MAEIEVEGKAGTKIKVKSADLGGVVLAIYPPEGEASAPAIWLEDEQAIGAFNEAISKAQGDEA